MAVNQLCRIWHSVRARFMEESGEAIRSNHAALRTPVSAALASAQMAQPSNRLPALHPVLGALADPLQQLLTSGLAQDVRGS